MKVFIGSSMANGCLIKQLHRLTSFICSESGLSSSLAVVYVTSKFQHQYHWLAKLVKLKNEIKNTCVQCTTYTCMCSISIEEHCGLLLESMHQYHRSHCEHLQSLEKQEKQPFCSSSHHDGTGRLSCVPFQNDRLWSPSILAACRRFEKLWRHHTLVQDIW